MRRVVVLILFSLPMGFSSAQTQKAVAQPTTWLGQVYFNPEIRYDRGASQDWENRSPLNLAVAIKRSLWAGLVEFSQFDETTGNVSSEIQRTHREMIFWLQRDLFAQPLTSKFSFALYGAAGLGLFEEEVTTTFMSDRHHDKSKPEFLTGLAGGVSSSFSPWLQKKNWALLVGMELRILLSREFDPNPQFSALGRVGFQF